MNDTATLHAGTGIKDVLLGLHEMGIAIEDRISALQTSFLYNKSIPATDWKATLEEFRDHEEELTRAITDSAALTAEHKPYGAVPGHLLRIAENVDALADLIDTKISEKILFSEKALKETFFLLQRLIEITRPTADLIIARNRYLSMYVQESQIGVGKMASEYATLHEDRLIKGVCIPEASAIYVKMLEAIKNIAWHAREIAVGLAP